MELEYDRAKDLWRGVLDLTGTTQMYLGIGSDTQRYRAAVTHSKTEHDKFKQTVKNVMREIMRVSPAGSPSFELAKLFIDDNYEKEKD